MDEVTKIVVEQSRSGYEWLNIMSVILALLTAISSFILTFWSLRITRNSANFLLYEKYNDEYFLPEMGRSIRILSELKQERGNPESGIDPLQKERLAELIKKKNNGDKLTEEESQWVSDVDQARRYVKSYFHKLATLHEEKVIEKKRTAKLCNKGGVYIYLKIVWELEKELYPGSPDIGQFDIIARIVYTGKKSL